MYVYGLSVSGALTSVGAQVEQCKENAVFQQFIF